MPEGRVQFHLPIPVNIHTIFGKIFIKFTRSFERLAQVETNKLSVVTQNVDVVLFVQTV